MRIGYRILAICSAAVLAGCTGGPDATVPPRLDAPPRVPAPSSSAAVCPVTRPGVVAGAASDTPWSAGGAYGNEWLWVAGLGPGGVIDDPRFVQPDASVSWKLLWYRVVPGRLQITGRRLDGPAPALRADIPAGYGGIGFQASGVDFPTVGCWEVTGTVANGGATTGRLTFVTLVRATRG
ncbi:MAG: hypothetical protein J2P15_11995 [Micromonosporaceae bacterium]|nr:hypothetical protein [Micromonosporaceae bacterium]